jgi:AcrR family transcriptional regulator
MPERSNLNEKQESRRNEILSVATLMFFEMGYAHTTMAAIQQEAGGSKRTLYQFFPSKESLFVAIVERTIARMNTETPVPLGTLDLRSNLVNVGEAFVRIITSIEGIAIYRTAVSEAAHSPTMAQTFLKIGPDENHECLAQYLQTQSEAGLIDVSNPKMAAAQLLGAMRSELHLEAVLTSKIPSKRMIRKHVTAAVDTFLAGVQHR